MEQRYAGGDWNRYRLGQHQDKNHLPDAQSERSYRDHAGEQRQCHREHTNWKQSYANGNHRVDEKKRCSPEEKPVYDGDEQTFS